MTDANPTMSPVTLNCADPRLDLRIGFQPMIAKGTSNPFAWQAVATGIGGRSFAALSATLLPEQRPALEARRITRSLERAAALRVHVEAAFGQARDQALRGPGGRLGLGAFARRDPAARARHP